MIDKSSYQQLVHQTAPKSKHLKTMFFAFIIGGLICCVGEGVSDGVGALFPQLDKDSVSGVVAIVMIFLGALLTGVGIYDDIGNIAGGGSIVPITGFANSIVSPAMEYKREGYVLGVGANLFKIAGPVLVYGIGSSILCGFIYYIFTLVK